MENDQKEKDTGMESLFAEWTKSATDLWGNMARMQTGVFWPFAPSDTGKGSGQKTQKAWESSGKIVEALAKMFTDPENLDSFWQSYQGGIDSLPEFFMKMTRQSWDGYMDLQTRWAERAAKMGQTTKAYNFDDIDQETFTLFREIYEKEIQKFLNVPQLGLNRFYQERMAKAVDKHNIYQAALGEFLYMFYIPIEKTSGVMQEKVGELIENGEISDNFKDYYNMWIKILEGHYMTLLQSPEYTRVMNNTINALVNYRKARDEVLYDILQKLPIPTNKDMDELYKDFYLLKKKVRELSAKLEKLTE